MSHYTSVAYFPLWAPMGLIKLAFLEFDCQGLQLTNLGQKSGFFTRYFEDDGICIFAESVPLRLCKKSNSCYKKKGLVLRRYFLK